MEVINTIISEINNREKSIIIWSSMFFLWAITRKEIRSAFFGVLKAFFTPKLFLPFLVYSAYITFIIFLFSKIGFWKSFLLKDTLVWFFGFAFINYVNINKVNEKEGYIKKILIDNLKLFVIIQFIVNMYVFSLPVELIITPTVTILVGMQTIANYEEKYRDVQKILNGILSIIGIVFIIFSFSKALSDSGKFFSSITFHKLILPPILYIPLIPFIYLLALAILYETKLIRLKIKEYYKPNLRQIRVSLLKKCNFNLNRLKRFQKIMFEYDLSTKKGLSLAMETIKSKRNKTKTV
jgi:hypothetical protein